MKCNYYTPAEVLELVKGGSMVVLRQNKNGSYKAAVEPDGIGLRAKDILKMIERKELPQDKFIVRRGAAMNGWQQFLQTRAEIEGRP